MSSIADATGLLGTVLGFGLAFKALSNINGEPHQLEDVHTTKASADEHAKRLKRRGKKTRVLKKKTKSGKTVYGVYSKVESKRKPRKKPKKK